MNCLEMRAGHRWAEGNQKRADAEPEATILWSPDAKSRFIGKDLNAGKD